jgi:VacB/RNase II family 3'-5' exoribonuclease
MTTMNSSSPPRKFDLRRIARRAMIDRGLLPDFSPAALSELDADRAAAHGGNDVRDERSRLWASIDNDDSRDLDQLSVAEAGPGGTARILVAIADVDALVRRGGPIDEHAAANTTSVYTAAEIFPMLPEKLSTDLTSLGPDAERLAIVVGMAVSADGAVTASEIYRATVVNRAKLAYDSVAAWLDGTGPQPAPIAAVPGLAENLRLQDRVAQTLRELRHQRGALGLETREARAVFDGDLITDLRPDETNRAKQLIEDLMIAANGVTAKYLAGRGFPSLRRVLRSPERWNRIGLLAESFGEHLPDAPDARALEGFLARRRQADAARFADLSLAVVKLIGAGEYALQVPGQVGEGHFALAVSDYTHSTAPNRRFPDLVTQRLLKAALAGQPAPYSNAELAAIATHCTEQTDNAAKVERQVRKSAAALLLGNRVGERFDGIVTGASSKGTWVRIDHPAAEGRVVRGFEGLDVGDRVRVELVRTDVERGFIDFAREVAS